MQAKETHHEKGFEGNGHEMMQTDVPSVYSELVQGG